ATTNGNSCTGTAHTNSCGVSGSTSGTLNCSGACITPDAPATTNGNSCTGTAHTNSCGMSGGTSGTYDCSGSCITPDAPSESLCSTPAYWPGYGACLNGSKSGTCTEQTGGDAVTCASLGFVAGVNTTTTGCPTASLSVNPSSVAYNGRPTLTWNSMNATSCTTSVNWSTSGNLSGSGLTDALKANATFTLQCFKNGGSSSTKSVSVTVGKLDGVCALTHSNCTDGVSANPVDGATTWTWKCNGDNGGTNASCTENKPSGSLSGSDCTISPGASSCLTSLNVSISNPTVGAATNVTKAGNVEVVSNATINNTFPKTVNNISVSYPSTTFFLNHNAGTLGSTTVNASCEPGISWDVPSGACAKVPTLGSPIDADVTALGVTLGATITDLGTPSTLIEKGVCYGTMPNPSLLNGATCTLNGDLVAGAYTVKVVGLLSPETYYYYRGYATNGAGTGYSADGNFTTLVRPPSAKVLKFESDATNGRIDFGKSIKLKWQSTNSLYGCSITSDGIPPINMSNLSSTNLTGLNFKPSKTTIYTLTCDGEGGKDSHSSESLKIQVGKMNPQFNEF
ncbi:hypothetical protein HXX01_03675, partial [Candidatus Nomurabacteria bacterium]|nr:hypothetical protein [Candidatus Nomurabacteria bacterium]